MEEKMRVLSQAEIAHLTKCELHALLRVTASELPYLPENSPDCARRTSLAQYPHALARAEFKPR